MTELIDPCGRKIEYVRLSVTDKCNLRCFYCMPKKFRGFQPPDRWLSFDEIERVIGAFAALGVSRVRITGGEPMVRKGLTDLVRNLSRLPGIEDLSLSTNATLLERFAEPLQTAGIQRINVSLDTLKSDRFAKLTGGRLSDVIDGLMAAKSVAFSLVKINMLALKGINDDEFEDMIEFCVEHGFTLRFIETMPVGSPGRSAGQHYLNLQHVKLRLARKFDLVPTVMPGGGPARYFQIGDTGLRLGFITPISQHFCQTCNRVRLSVDGTLYLCLGQDHKYELRPLLRSGASDECLRQAVLDGIAHKPARHEFQEKPWQIVRFMSTTGG